MVYAGPAVATIAFPVLIMRVPVDLELEWLSRELEIWKRTLFRFVQQVYFLIRR